MKLALKFIGIGILSLAAVACGDDEPTDTGSNDTGSDITDTSETVDDTSDGDTATDVETTEEIDEEVDTTEEVEPDAEPNEEIGEDVEVGPDAEVDEEIDEEISEEIDEEVDTTPEAVCGNNEVEDGEACDDGNVLPGDGCSPSCQTETASCTDDAEEPNENEADSTAIATDVDPPFAVADMVSAGGNDDWFSFRANVGDAIAAKVTYDTAMYDLTIAIYNVGESTPIAVSDGEVGNGAQVEFVPEGFAAGTFYAVVSSPTGTCAPYTVTYEPFGFGM